MDMRMFILYSMFLNVGFVTGSCPPIGSYECIDISRYGGRQYATCLTHAYIQALSGKRHICEGWATTCWYQCMLESHDKNNGEVTPDCSCETASFTLTPEQQLPSECYSPSGQDCDWYTDCLEKRYPCRNDPASYAVDFAQRFCSMYGEHYSSFSTVGQRWVDAVRKCLQVKLVPTLRPGQEKTCAELKDFALGTHAGCYLDPDGGHTSVCFVKISDFLQVFWTLEEGFDSLWNHDKEMIEKAIWPTLKQALTVVTGCGRAWTIKGIMSIINFVNDVVNDVNDEFQSVIGRRRRSVDNSISMANAVFDVTNQVSSTMNWDEKHLMWFGFPMASTNDSTTGLTTLQIRIVLAPKALYDLNAVNISMANVSAEIEELSDAIVNGDIKFDLGTGVNATLFKVCTDLNCTIANFEAVPQNAHTILPTRESEEGIPSIVKNVLIGIGVVVVVGLLIICAVCGYKKIR